MKLPQSLASDRAALKRLEEYYGKPPEGPSSRTGAAFDSWDSTGSREADADRFTADDVVAVSLLSVYVPAEAVRQMLVDRRAEFSALLERVGPDRDLVEVAEPFLPDGPEWALDAALCSLPGVGKTTASKLFARKRPRLRPIWDSVVSQVMDTKKQHWEPIRLALRDDDGQLHRRLLNLRDEAGLSRSVSALRVLDTIAWRDGKDQGLRPQPDIDAGAELLEI